LTNYLLIIIKLISEKLLIQSELFRLVEIHKKLTYNQNIFKLIKLNFLY